MNFMPSSPCPPRAGWMGSPRARQTWGLSRPPASALQSLLLCTSSLPRLQRCSPLSLGFHCSSLSPQTAKVSSLWKVFNFRIKLEPRLLILCRASADLLLHSPWSELATSERPLPHISHDSTNGSSCTLVLLGFPCPGVESIPNRELKLRQLQHGRLHPQGVPVAMLAAPLLPVSWFHHLSPDSLSLF